MKHVFISVLIFSLVLMFCIWSAIAVHRSAEPVRSLLTAAQRSMENQNPKNAGEFAAMAHQAWQKNERLFGILLHHDETDDVMRNFSVLMQQAEADNPDSFVCVCAQLVTQLEHIDVMQHPTLENIL